MRNPFRKSLYCILALLAGVALILLGYSRIGEHWTAIVPVVLGFAISPYAIVTLVQALFASRGQALLRAGRGVIARWHIHPGDWDQFRKLDERRSAEDPSLYNDLWIRKVTPARGVDVIVGEKSLLVDRSYHVLRPSGLPGLRNIALLDSQPNCLEFALAYPRGRYGGTLHLTLRIPFPRGAMEAAQRVMNHFEPLTRRKPGIALRNPSKTYRLCLILFLVSVGSAWVGFSGASSPPEGAGSIVVLILIIAGISIGTFAVALSFITFLLTRRT